MLQKICSSHWCVVLILVLIELGLSSPQGYNYYSNQQRINAQRAQSQRLQAQRVQAQNRYQQAYRTTRSPYNSYRNGVNRADSENAKFLGSQNQEPENTGKTFNFIRRKKQYGFGANPCYFRSADQQPAEGRFLWDLNVYNIHPPSYGGGGGCGGGFGGNYGNRPLSDGFFQNFISLFTPGGALYQDVSQNRPFQSPIQSDSNGSGGLPSGVQNDYDPNLSGTGSGGSTGNIGSTSSALSGAPPLTPGQLVGGVATTVNGIIQQLTGNIRPVYRGYG